MSSTTSTSNTTSIAFAKCTGVSSACPVEATIYTYRPNLGANAFFLVLFALCCLVQLVIGIKNRTWTFAIALVLGCALEVVGYAGRIMLHDNPWSTEGFEIQIICLIIAPAFIAAGVYLTLKHFVIITGERFSTIRPKYYTWIFISADIFSLVLQGAGGGLSASGSSYSLVQTGTWIALAGIIFQVVSLAVFGILAGAFSLRVYRKRTTLTQESVATLRSLRFRMLAAAVFLAYITILTRCCYRIPELSGGWRNEVMLSEVEFIVLDGAMMAIATLSLTVLHPGEIFPALLAYNGKRDTQKNVPDSSSSASV